MGNYWLTIRFKFHNFIKILATKQELFLPIKFIIVTMIGVVLASPSNAQQPTTINIEVEPLTSTFLSGWRVTDLENCQTLAYGSWTILSPPTQGSTQTALSSGIDNYSPCTGTGPWQYNSLYFKWTGTDTSQTTTHLRAAWSSQGPSWDHYEVVDYNIKLKSPKIELSNLIATNINIYLPLQVQLTGSGPVNFGELKITLQGPEGSYTQSFGLRFAGEHTVNLDMSGAPTIPFDRIVVSWVTTNWATVEKTYFPGTIEPPKAELSWRLNEEYDVLSTYPILTWPGNWGYGEVKVSLQGPDDTYIKNLGYWQAGSSNPNSTIPLHEIPTGYYTTIKVSWKTSWGESVKSYPISLGVGPVLWVSDSNLRPNTLTEFWYFNGETVAGYPTTRRITNPRGGAGPYKWVFGGGGRRSS